MGFDVSTQFTQATELKDYTFTLINNVSKKTIEFTKGEVPELEISYNGFIILSYAIINDQTDVLHVLDSSKQMSFVPFILDVTKGYYRREFAVVRIDRSQNPHQKTLTCYGQDIISYTLSKLYISKTYSGQKLSDIFTDIYNTYVKPKILYNPSIYTLDVKSDFTLEQFVLTSQKSVLDFILEECQRQGLCLYQDKGRVIMTSYRELTPGSLPVNPTTYDNSSDTSAIPSIQSILAYRVCDGNQAFMPAKAQVTAYDPSNKTNKIMKVNLEDLGIDAAEESQDYDGFTYASQEYITDDNLFADTYKAFLSSSRINIIVPGYVLNINLWTKYKLTLRAVENPELLKEGDRKKSGEYILTSYVDKITQSRYYITKMTLSRFKDTST